MNTNETERIRRGPMTIEEIKKLRAEEGIIMDMEDEEPNTYVVKAYDDEKMSAAVGRIFKQARRELGYTQQEIAETSGVKRPNIARLESGKHSPTVDMLQRVAYSMGMDMEIHLKERKDDGR
ncbi:MAG: helix-turn-helix transcriptional regulator [Eubacteriales bacterium]|nr:helix-turn-helix transcriptional regulator [Eubacteriales bacterium]